MRVHNGRLLRAAAVFFLPVSCSAAADQDRVRIAVIADAPETFTAFMSRFPATIEKWQWSDLESRPLEGISAVYLLADPRYETLTRPARVLSRNAILRLHAFVRRGGGYYAECLTPAVSPAPAPGNELFGFTRAPGISSVGILKVVKTRATTGPEKHWITEAFPDDQLWQVRAATYQEGKPSSGRDRVLLELTPAVGTYRIYHRPDADGVPVLIAPAASEGRGFFATVPLTRFAENGYGPRAAWEQLVERIVLAPLAAEVRAHLMSAKLTLRSWTEPRVWAPANGGPANLQLVVECRPDALLHVSGIALNTPNWTRSGSQTRRAALRLPAGEHRLRITADWAGRRVEEEVPLTISSREEWYRKSLDRSMAWFRHSGTLPARDGSQGVLEGFRSLDHETNTAIRSDCATESALAFYLYGQLTASDDWRRTALNVISFLLREGFQDQDRQRATFGFWNFYDTLQGYPQTVFTHDNAWAAYAMLRLFRLTGMRDYLSRGLWTVDGLVGTQPAAGLRTAAMSGRELLDRGRRWFVENGRTSTDPHYVSSGDEAALLAYFVTGNRKYLDSARRSVDAMMAVFPAFTTNTTLTRATQFARFLASPVLMYRATGEERYRDVAAQIVEALNAHQDVSGAIREWGNPIRNNFGEEGPVITLEGEPISDQLYTTNFALLHLHEACLVGNRQACETFEALADYLTRIQIRGGDPRTDGAWNRAFDFRNWEMFGSTSDPYWGPYSIESGWTNAIISIALADYLERQSGFGDRAR